MRERFPKYLTPLRLFHASQSCKFIHRGVGDSLLRARFVSSASEKPKYCLSWEEVSSSSVMLSWFLRPEA